MSHRSFEVQVYLNELPEEAVTVELYADPLEGGRAVCQPLQRGSLLDGTTHAYIHHGTVADNRPRIAPAHGGALLPLEADFILWYR